MKLLGAVSKWFPSSHSPDGRSSGYSILKSARFSLLGFAVGFWVLEHLLTSSKNSWEDVGIVQKVFPSLIRVFDALSMAMFTAFVIAVFYEKHVVTALRESLKDDIEQYARSKDRLLHSGVIDMREGLPWPEIAEESTKGIDEFLVVQTWSPQLPNLLASLESFMALNPIRVRVFLLNPDSQYARGRSVALGYDEEYVPSLIRLNIEELRVFYQRLQDHLDDQSLKELVTVTLFDEMPSHCVYRIGSTAWIGSFLTGKRADRGPVMRVVCDKRTSVWASILDMVKVLQTSQKSQTLDLTEVSSRLSGKNPTP